MVATVITLLLGIVAFVGGATAADQFLVKKEVATPAHFTSQTTYAQSYTKSKLSGNLIGIDVASGTLTIESPSLYQAGTSTLFIFAFDETAILRELPALVPLGAAGAEKLRTYLGKPMIVNFLRQPDGTLRTVNIATPAKL